MRIYSGDINLAFNGVSGCVDPMGYNNMIPGPMIPSLSCIRNESGNVGGEGSGGKGPDEIPPSLFHKVAPRVLSVLLISGGAFAAIRFLNSSTAPEDRSTEVPQVPVAVDSGQASPLTHLPSGSPTRSVDIGIADFLRTKTRGDFDFPPDLPPYSLTRYDSVRQALDHQLARQPRVITFGELHFVRGYQGTTALSIFLEQILPYLAVERGYRRLVMEKLPSDFQGVTGREVEVQNYIALLRNRPESAYLATELEDIFRVCQRHGVVVDGGNLTVGESQTLLQGSRPSPEYSMRIGILTRDHMKETLIRAAARGPVIGYGGILHIPPSPDVCTLSTANAGGGHHVFDLSYGPDLSMALQRQGYRYTAIALDMPSQLTTYFYSQGRTTGQLPYDLVQPLWFFLSRQSVPPSGQVSTEVAERDNAQMVHMIFPWDRGSE